MKARTLLLFRILMVLYIAAVAVLCFAHFRNMTEVPTTIFGLEADKVVHFLMFLPFPLLAYLALGKQPKTPWRALWAILALFFTGSLIAAGTEIGQSFLPYRSADPMDFKADTLALAIGSLVAFIVMLWRGAPDAPNAQ